MTKHHHLSSPARRRGLSRRWLAAGASCLVLAALLAPPAAAASLQGAINAQGSASAAAAATRATQNQAAAAIAAATGGSANLTRATNALKAAIAAQNAAARTVSSFNGLGVGALDPATSGCATCLDTTWTGADRPTQVITPDGTYDVTVNQTQANSVLSWVSFNVGSKTRMTFDQHGHADWIVANRVVGNAASPSEILGAIRADGTVLVINQNGIVFGAGAQINVHSLIASTLEVGRFIDTLNGVNTLRTLTERNAEFLEYGLTGYAETNTIGSTFSGTTDGTLHADATVSVEQGASITAKDGGLILLAAPTVTNAGHLSAADGQVSLIGVNQYLYTINGGGVAAGNVTLVETDGAKDSKDPYVRGYLLVGGGGAVTNTATGVIEADRGYISLGGYLTSTSLIANSGRVTNDGILASTTAVSANGTIDLMGATITLGAGSLIVVAPDGKDETITRAADSVAKFKASQVRIGSYASDVTMGEGAMIVAPSGSVTLGDPAGKTFYNVSTAGGRITLESGAVIDVAGLRDVPVPVSAYNLSILLKGNELADSGGYQTSFLNGQTVWIDARLSGVRDDGVAWIGSPLLSVASYYEAVGVGVAQLMTGGGHVTLGTAGAVAGASTASAPGVWVQSGALIDISGGWVTYGAGAVKTSKLVTRDGRVVDIGAADPLKDVYAAVYTGSSATHGHWGVVSTYKSFEPSTANSVEPSYTEGRDAGTLTIKSARAVYEGTLSAAAYAGLKQIAAGEAGSARGTTYGDSRSLQAATTQLPSGGLLFLQQVGDPATGTIVGGGEIKVVAAADYAREDGVTVLSDELLSQSGLSQVSLWSSGAIRVARGARVALEAGGVFDAYSGRSITIAGTVSVPSGSIVLETANFGLSGSMFTTADDAVAVGSFDVTVPGTLSVAGQWVNDRGKAASEQTGGAWLNGGTITIVTAAGVSDHGTVANATTALTDGATATDVSGSIHLEHATLIDLSGGGRVTSSGALQLTGRGGSLALINQTAFHQVQSDFLNKVVGPVYGQISGFRVHHGSDSRVDEVQINPGAVTSTVQFDPGVIKAAGFSGGGSFTLWSPDIAFGSGSADDTALATVVPLSFFQAGFSTYRLTSYQTLLDPNRFVSSSGSSLGGYNAILRTQTFHVRAGETLTLSQALLPTDLNATQASALMALATGGDVTRVLTASVPRDTWDQRAVALTLDGMVELVVDPGGTVTAAPGATLTVAKLLNQGTIRLPGGTLRQSQTLPEIFSADSTTPAYAVHALSDLFTVEADGSIVETRTSRAAGGLSNAEIAYNGLVYLLGGLEADQGIVLAAGSVTDLSGVSVVNPHVTVAGTRTGTVHAGGTLALAPESVVAGSGFYRAAALSFAPSLTIGSTVRGRTLTIAGGATVDLDGAADTYSQGGGTTPVWSDAGRISAPNGFTLSSDAILSAHGGASSAEGGTLELADVILTQSVAGTANRLAADQITAAGFTTLAVLGTLGSDGDVSLSLGKALYLASRPYAGTSAAGVAAEKTNDYAVTIRAGGDLAITAPYIGLLSSVDQLRGGTTTGTGAGHGVTLTATKAFDVAGAVLFDRSVGAVTLVSDGDFRLVGVQNYLVTYGLTTKENTALTALLAVNGDLTLRAAQVYPATGTSATIRATGDVTFARTTTTLPDTPYSAGGSLTVAATDILQGGVVRVPLGRLTLTASGALTLADGSVTSVSADGLSIPYGTTTDGKEWYFTPIGGTALTRLPEKVLTLSGNSIAVASGATVNISGGGDVTAYEFAAGTKGSRDVLSARNDDPYTSRTGCTYVGCAQAYAIVPGLSDAAVAAYDPVYSADYAALSSMGGAGTRVQLNLGDGLKWYSLLPAHYATLSGGRLVVVRGTTAAAAGSRVSLADGTVLATGLFGNTLSGASDSTVYSFAVQPESVYSKYSLITLTSGNDYFTTLAAKNGTTVPRLARDAGRLVLDATSRLVVDAVVKSAAAPGGRGAQVDIGGAAIAIVSTLPADTSGALYITAGSITNLNAESVLIGGTRTDNNDGTTTLAVGASSIRVANDADHAIGAAEILLAATGSITVADGSVITAGGSLSDQREGAYLLGDETNAGTGALLRVANGPERLTSRSHFTGAASLAVGAATLSGRSVMFDSSGAMALANGLTLRHATSVALAAGRIGLGVTDAGYDGVVVTPQIQALLTQGGGRLTLRSQSAIDFADGTYRFGDVRLDAATLAGTGGGAVVVAGDTVTLSNAGGGGVACTTCAAKDGSLTIAADTLLFSGGTLATQATTTTAAATAKLVAAVAVTLPAGTPVVNGNSTTPLNSDTTILIPAGTAVSLASGSALVGGRAANGSVAAGTEITTGGSGYTLTSGTTYTTPTGGSYTLAADAVVTLPGGAAMTLTNPVPVDRRDFFGGGVTLAASQGIYVTGRKAGLDAGSAALTLHTPYLGDRASTASAGKTVIPDLTLATTGALAIDRAGAAALDLSRLGGVAGTAISLTGGSVAITGATVHASAGTLTLTADGSITLGDGAVVEAPGLTSRYGDGTDGTTANSPAGTVALTARHGDIDLGAGSRVSVANGGGDAGRLALSAVEGTVRFGGAIDGTAASGSTGGTFALESGGAVDLVALNGRVAAHGFTGGFEVTSHHGDLTLAAGETLRSGAIKLTADGGFVIIAGTIDSSGQNGGDITLSGNQGVTLAATARLDAHADGYAATDTRQASAGTVTLATDFVAGSTRTDADGRVTGTSGVISVQRGAVIDLTAKRPYARLVALPSRTGYTFVEGDRAGTLVIRAPVVQNAAGHPTVMATVESAASVAGAGKIKVEGFTRWDLAKVAASGSYTGVTVDAAGNVTLDVSAGLDRLSYDSATRTFTVTDAGGGLNFLGDIDHSGTHATVAGVIQDFDLSAATTGSGGLAALATAYGDQFTTAPGIELVSTGDLTLASNWNLAAAVVDTTRALANGLMGSESYNGTTVTYVKSGSEAALLENYTGMLYRVGGSVTGAAPVLTLRAGGDLTVNGIVTDGYFSFQDTSNPTYLLSQTGVAGGYILKFGGGFSSSTTSSIMMARGYYLNLWTGDPTNTSKGKYTTVTQDSAVVADPLDYIPYSADANSAAPPQTRNTFTSMEVFPTLDGAAQMDSTTYRLVAGSRVSRGAGDVLDVGTDPMGLNPAFTGSIALNGYSYTSSGSGGEMTIKVYYSSLNGPISSNTKYASEDTWMSSLLTNTYSYGAFSGRAIYYGTSLSTYCKSGQTCATDSGSGAGSATGTVLINGASGTDSLTIDSASDLVYVSLNIDSNSVSSIVGAPVTLKGDGWTTVTFRDYVKSGADPYLYGLYYSNATVATAAGDFFTIAGPYGDSSANPYISTSKTTVMLVASVKTLAYILEKYIDPLFPSTVGGTTTTTTTRVPGILRTGTGGVALAAAGDVNLTGTNGTASVYTSGRQASGSEIGTTTATVIGNDGTPTGTASVDLGAYLGSKGFYLVDGGDIAITALGSVHGGSETLRATVEGPTSWLTSAKLATGVDSAADQEVRPAAFVGGVGALAGGAVSVSAGRDLDDVGAVATSAIRTVAVTLDDGSHAYALDYLGESNLSLRAGRDILGGTAWVTSGSARIGAGRDIASAGWSALGRKLLTDVRFLNATARIAAVRDAELYLDKALNWSADGSWSGTWYSASADLAAIANGDLTISFASPGLGRSTLPGTALTVLPGSVSLVAVAGDLDFLRYDSVANRAGLIMLPSDGGQLTLLAGGGIGAVTLVMDDADPANMQGPFVTVINGLYTARGLGFPLVTSATSEAERRLYHNQTLPHRNDAQPVRVMAGGDIEGMTLVTPKQTQVVAGGDIVDMVFFGQNLHAGDVTRIAAGGDITATSTIANARYLTDSGSWGTTSRGEATLGGNLFVIGGPGAFFLEAGGDIGPFLNSATVTVWGNTLTDLRTYTYAGGVLSVGYDWNPWLKPTVTAAGGGADLYVMFGLGAIGPDYAALADKYVNPAKAAALTDGGYGASLVAWLAERYGLANLTEAEAYAAFLALPAVDRHLFLLSQVYFNELEQVAVTTSPSYQVYSRGYAAVNTLFPTANGYTENGLAGGAVETDRVHTGDLDLRLAAIETTRGGDIRLLGPGGNILAGSVVRTATQAARRNYNTGVYNGGNGMIFTIDSIPTAYEGLITLRGGSISSFTDGSLVLNQSRLFTENGGDILAWSSNGDLNAGQGPKTAVNFTPIVVKYDWNLYGEVDPAGSVSGAGIAAFEPEPGVRAPDVYLLAPRGMVDAGDAGIRVAGDISIVAYQVRNADNIQVGGSSFGVPVTVSPSLGNALGASDTAAQAAGAAEDAARATRPAPTRLADLPSIIVFEVLGYGGSAGAEEPDGRRSRRPGDISYDPGASVRVVGLGLPR